MKGGMNSMDELEDLRYEIKELKKDKEDLEDEVKELKKRIEKMQDAGYEIYQM